MKNEMLSNRVQYVAHEQGRELMEIDLDKFEESIREPMEASLQSKDQRIEYLEEIEEKLMNENALLRSELDELAMSISPNTNNKG